MPNTSETQEDAAVEAEVVKVETLKAAVVIGDAKAPAGAKLVIITEQRVYAEDGSSTAKLTGYHAGADLYFRTDPEVVFPKTAKEVLTLGVDVIQENFWGFTRQAGWVCVGPAHPAYAAANLAFQRGATEIAIVGLTDAEKEKLRPYFDDLPNHPAAPAQVAVSLL